MWGNLLSRLWGSAHEHLSVYDSARSALGDRIYRYACCCCDRGCNRQIRLLTLFRPRLRKRAPSETTGSLAASFCDGN
jgi:hypothetical protein